MKVGSKRKEQVFKNYFGLGMVTVQLLNPTPEQEKQFYDLAEEPKETEYFGKKEFKYKTLKDGKVVEVEKELKYANIVLHVENQEGVKLKFTIANLVDRDSVSVKEGQPIKYEWVNQTGQNAWAVDEKGLSLKFKNFTDKEDEIVAPKIFRKAKVGEASLVKFLDKLLDVEYLDSETGDYKNLVDFDPNDVLKGKFKEFKDLLKGDLTRDIGIFAYINENEKDGETKKFQGIWRELLYADDIKKILAAKITPEKVNELIAKQKEYNENNKVPGEKKKYLTNFEKFILSIVDKQYGPTGSYAFLPLQEADDEKKFSMIAGVTYDETGDDY